MFWNIFCVLVLDLYIKCCDSKMFSDASAELDSQIWCPCFFHLWSAQCIAAAVWENQAFDLFLGVLKESCTAHRLWNKKICCRPCGLHYRALLDPFTSSENLLIFTLFWVPILPCVRDCYLLVSFFVILVGCWVEQKACSSKFCFFLLAHACSAWFSAKYRNISIRDDFVEHSFVCSCVSCLVQQWKVWYPPRETDIHLKRAWSELGRRPAVLCFPKSCLWSLQTGPPRLWLGN